MPRSQNHYSECANCRYDPEEEDLYERQAYLNYERSLGESESLVYHQQGVAKQPQRRVKQHRPRSLTPLPASEPLIPFWSVKGSKKHRVAAWIGGNSEYAGSGSDVRTRPCDVHGYPPKHRHSRISVLPSVPTPRYFHVNKMSSGKRPSMLSMPLPSQVDPETTAIPSKAKRRPRLLNYLAAPMTKPVTFCVKPVVSEKGNYPYQLSYTSHGGGSKSRIIRVCPRTGPPSKPKVGGVANNASVSGFSRFGSSSETEHEGRPRGSREHPRPHDKPRRRSRDYFEVVNEEGWDVSDRGRSRSRRSRDDNFETGFVATRVTGEGIEPGYSRSRQRYLNSDTGFVGDTRPKSAVPERRLDTFEDRSVGRVLDRENIEPVILERSRNGRDEFVVTNRGRGETHSGVLRASREKYKSGHSFSRRSQERDEAARTRTRRSHECSSEYPLHRLSPKLRVQELNLMYSPGSDAPVTKPPEISGTTLEGRSSKCKHCKPSGRSASNREMAIKDGSSNSSCSIRQSERSKYGPTRKHPLKEPYATKDLSCDDLNAVIKARSQDLDTRLAQIAQSIDDKRMSASSSVITGSSTSGRHHHRRRKMIPRVPEDVTKKRLTQEHLVKAYTLSTQALPVPQESKQGVSPPKPESQAAASGSKVENAYSNLMTDLDAMGCGNVKIDIQGILQQLQKNCKKAGDKTPDGNKSDQEKPKDARKTSSSLAESDPREAYEQIYRQQSSRSILSKQKLSYKFIPKKEINFDEILKQRADRANAPLQVQELWTNKGNFRNATPETSKTEQVKPSDFTTVSRSPNETSNVAVATKPESTLDTKFQRSKSPQNERVESPDVSPIQENGPKYNRVNGMQERSSRDTPQNDHRTEQSNASQAEEFRSENREQPQRSSATQNWKVESNEQPQEYWSQEQNQMNNADMHYTDPNLQPNGSPLNAQNWSEAVDTRLTFQEDYTQQQQIQQQQSYYDNSSQQDGHFSSQGNFEQSFPIQSNIPERDQDPRSSSQQTFAPENVNVSNPFQQVYNNDMSRPIEVHHMIPKVEQPDRDMKRSMFGNGEHYDPYQISQPEYGVLEQANCQGDWAVASRNQETYDEIYKNEVNRLSGVRHQKPEDKWMQLPRAEGDHHPNYTHVGKWRQQRDNGPPTDIELCDESLEFPNEISGPQPIQSVSYCVNTNQRVQIGDCGQVGLNPRAKFASNLSVPMMNLLPPNTTVRRILTKLGKKGEVKSRIVSSRLEPEHVRLEAQAKRNQRTHPARRDMRVWPTACDDNWVNARRHAQMTTKSAVQEFPSFIAIDDTVEENWNPKMRVQPKFPILNPPKQGIKTKLDWNAPSLNHSNLPPNKMAAADWDDVSKLKTDYYSYKYWEEQQLCDPKVDVTRPDGDLVPYVDQDVGQVALNGCCSDSDVGLAASVRSSKSYILQLIDQVVNRETGSVLEERRVGPPTVVRSTRPQEVADDVGQSFSLHGSQEISHQSLKTTDSLGNKLTSSATCNKCAKVAKKAQWLKEFRCDSLKNISNVVTQLVKLERVVEDTHCQDHAVTLPNTEELTS